MPILGIDYNKCSYCRTCILTCPRCLFNENELDKIIFQDSKQICIKCGHCIARCPEDAVLFEGMGDSFTFEGVDKPEMIISNEPMFNFLKVHRSIRLYKKEKVPVSILRKVFEAMDYAPTGRNMRSETFAILSDQLKLITLSDAIIEELTKDPHLNALYGNRFSILKKEFQAPIFFDAPHVIFVYSSFISEIEDINIGNIITYGRLAAHSLGLGTCWNAWTSIAMGLNPKLMEIPRIQGKKVGVFTIGYPDVTFYRTPPRKFKSVKGLED
jgi:nitroreductase/NAD-dependent dihydropyrimidine dehydrogenase PreA subunit